MKIKASYFNNFFASQCTSLLNNSKLPDKITYNSVARLTSIKFENNDILKIIRSLNVNKTHRNDCISVRTIKICDESLVHWFTCHCHLFLGVVLMLVFLQILGRNLTQFQVHKKGDKQIANNCRPVSLLPICSKVLEKIIVDSLMKFLNENKLSSFRPSDSCEYQLLWIVHDLNKSFDYNTPLEVREIFLDISKAFDRVWLDRLIYKIK